MLDIASRTLGEMAVDIADDLGHVLLVSGGQFRFVLVEDRDDPPAGGMTGRFTPVLVLARAFRLVRFQPFGQFVGRHVHRGAELFSCVVTHAVFTSRATMLTTYPLRGFSKPIRPRASFGSHESSHPAHPR